MREFEVRMGERPRIVILSSDPLPYNVWRDISRLSYRSDGRSFETLPQYLEQAKKVLLGACFYERPSK
jgi:hypothetical protein